MATNIQVQETIQYDRQPKLIAITGPTGTGKTTFINLLCQSQLPVGSGLESCTTKVQIARCNKIDNHNIVLIDTPGFDNTDRSEADIFREIARFLEKIYENNRTLAGIIYMHRISDCRVGGVSLENFRLFQKICGNVGMRNVAIVTTMWDFVEENTAVTREEELKTDPLFFQPAIGDGAQMYRHNNSNSSAENILKQLLLQPMAPLQIQKEIVTEKKAISATDAGKALHEILMQKLADNRTIREGIQRSSSESTFLGNADRRERKKRLRAIEKRLGKIELELEKLSKPPKKSRWFSITSSICIDVRDLFN